MPAVIGCSVTLASIRSSASSPSATVTSHRSSHRRSTVPVMTPMTTKGRLARASFVPTFGTGIPSCRWIFTAPPALGRAIALQLGEQCFGAEGFEDRETLPCPRGGLPGDPLGRKRCHGAHRVARPANGPTRRSCRGHRRARPLLPGFGRARAARRTRRTDGIVAPRRHQLWRELPIAPVRQTDSWPCRCLAKTIWRPCPPGSSSTSCRGPSLPCGHPSPPICSTATRTCSWREDNSWASRWRGSASRAGHAGVVRSPLGEAAPRPDPAGLIVVDLSALWAGPLCGDLLARAGATVVKVESTQRPDGARRGPAEFFDLLNGRKQIGRARFSESRRHPDPPRHWSDGPMS